LKRKADQEQQQRKQQSSLRLRNARTERSDGDHDEDAEDDSGVGASWFAQSMPGDDDTFASTTMDNGRHDVIDDEWKNKVLADVLKEHDGSLERAVLHVLAKFDCHLV
jgi:hypothetical protein